MATSTTSLRTPIATVCGSCRYAYVSHVFFTQIVKNRKTLASPSNYTTRFGAAVGRPMTTQHCTPPPARNVDVFVISPETGDSVCGVRVCVCVHAYMCLLTTCYRSDLLEFHLTHQVHVTDVCVRAHAHTDDALQDVKCNDVK